MKRMTVVGMIVAGATTVGQASAQDHAGSNQGGNEKVCFLSAAAQSEQGLVDALKSCKRGDILDIGWLQTPAAMQLCDFTKAVLYHPTKGSVIACVYTGSRRQVIK